MSARCHRFFQWQRFTLETVAAIRIVDGPPMLKSENARLSGWVYIDVRGRDLASVVNGLRQAVDDSVKIAPGMSISYSGQFEFLERANAGLKLVVPATLAIIFVLLYLTFRRTSRKPSCRESRSGHRLRSG